MGLTHYWQRKIELPEKAFKGAVADCEKIIKFLNVPLGNAHGKNEPLFIDNKVEFNGVIGYGCEPFKINRIQPPRPGRRIVTEYCKTEHLPYDLCVQCALIIFQHHLGHNIKVMSDGSDYDWDEAKKICMKYLNYGSTFTLMKDSDN